MGYTQVMNRTRLCGMALAIAIALVGFVYFSYRLVLAGKQHDYLLCAFMALLILPLCGICGINAARKFSMEWRGTDTDHLDNGVGAMAVFILVLLWAAISDPAH